jgi:hypothetical protein
MAKCTLLSDRTVLLPPRVCTLTQSVAAGGGVVVGVLVGVGEVLGDVEGVAVGVLSDPPGETGGVGAPLPGVELLVEPGLGAPVPGLGVTLPPPGLGSGVGGGGVAGPEVPVGGDGGGDCEVAVAAAPAEWCWAARPAEKPRAAASRRMGC